MKLGHVLGVLKFPLDIYHSHQGQYIYIIHQSSINLSFDIDQSLDINQSNHWHQWQHDPTISPFGIDGNTNIDFNTNYQTPITNYWCQHVDKACSTSIVNVTISPYQSLPSIDINHINVIISPPLTSMAKGHSPLGAAPPVLLLLYNRSPFV